MYTVTSLRSLYLSLNITLGTRRGGPKLFPYFSGTSRVRVGIFSYFMCTQAEGSGYFRGAANGPDILRRAGAWQNPREATPNKTLAASLPLVS